MCMFFTPLPPVEGVASDYGHCNWSPDSSLFSHHQHHWCHQFRGDPARVLQHQKQPGTP